MYSKLIPYYQHHLSPLLNLSVPGLNNLNRLVFLYFGCPVQNSCHTCGKSDSPVRKGENEKVSHYQSQQHLQLSTYKVFILNFLNFRFCEDFVVK